MTTTLLGGIDPNPNDIAAAESYLFTAMASTNANAARYTLPGLVNTEAPVIAWEEAQPTQVIRSVTTDGTTVYGTESPSTGSTCRIYSYGGVGGAASKTLLGSVSVLGSAGIALVTYNPARDSLWLLFGNGNISSIYELDVAGGTPALVDTITFSTSATSRLLKLSVDDSGGIWGIARDGTSNSNYSERIFRWDENASRTEVYTSPSGQADRRPAPGLALADGTFLFAHDETGNGDLAWYICTQGGSISATTLLDGPSAPYPEPATDHTMSRFGLDCYVEQAAGETSFETDIFYFESPALAAGTRWFTGVAGW